MRNVLNYYYGMDVSNIHQKDKFYYFIYHDALYIMMACDKPNIQDIYEYTVYLKQFNYPCHEIIVNKFDSLLTIYDNCEYVLMKVFVTRKTIDINDILHSNVEYISDKLKLLPWHVLWSSKVDYLEYQMNQMGKKSELIRDSFNYYIGLAENAISLSSGLSSPYCLSHDRIHYNDSLIDLYNPLFFVIDFKYRDICEYFKSCYFNGVDNDIFCYIDNYVYTYDDGCLFLSRMLFPTYYFDVYEKIINDIDDSSLNVILDLVYNYEALLKNINAYLNRKFSIPILDWLR